MIPIFSVLLLTGTLQWNANTEPDLAGYKVYWRTSDATNLVLNAPWTAVTNVGLQTKWQLLFEPNKYYYFCVTAYNASGNESDDSSPTIFVIFVRPEDTEPQASLLAQPPPSRWYTKDLMSDLADRIKPSLPKRTTGRRMIRTTTGVPAPDYGSPQEALP